MQEWLDTGRVLVATKCNQLMELDVQSGQQRSIELPPEPPQRPHPTVDSGGRQVAIDGFINGWAGRWHCKDGWTGRWQYIGQGAGMHSSRRSRMLGAL